MVGELEEDAAACRDVCGIECYGDQVGNVGLEGVMVGEDDSLEEIDSLGGLRWLK